MASPIHPYSTSVFTPMEKGKVKSRSTYERIRNVLTGRVFENWREQLLSVATVYYVIKAAISFFSGHFFVCIAEFITSAFMAILRKEIHDFTNLHKATGLIREQNMEFALSNLDLRDSINQFKAKLDVLTQQNERFERSNEDYSYNNKVHEELIAALGQTSLDLGEEIRTALASGTTLTKDVLERYLQQLQKFEETKGILVAVKDDLTNERKEALERFEALTDQVKNMTVDGVKNLNEANQRLQKILIEISAAEARATSLSAEIDRLKRERQRITSAVDRLEITANRSQPSGRGSNSPFGFLRLV